MMLFVIDPYVGAGPLRLGTTSAEVRAALGVEPKSVRKSPLSEYPSDMFLSLGVQAHYRAPGICEAFELHKPAEVVLYTTRLLGQPFDQLLSWFRSIDPAVELNDAGLTSTKLGVGLYAPAGKKEPRDPTEGVIVFVKDYYEAARARIAKLRKTVVR